MLWGVARLPRGVRRTGSRRSSRAVARARLHRFLAALHPLRDARRRVPAARRQPVPRLHRRARAIRSISSIDGRARQHRLKTLFRLFLAVPAFLVVARARRRPVLRGGRPRLVRGSRHRPDAQRASQSSAPLRCATPRSRRVPVRPHGSLPLRRPRARSPRRPRRSSSRRRAGARPRAASRGARRTERAAAARSLFAVLAVAWARRGRAALATRGPGRPRRSPASTPQPVFSTPPRSRGRSATSASCASSSSSRSSCSSSCSPSYARWRGARLMQRVRGRADRHRDAARDARARASSGSRRCRSTSSTLWWDRRHDLAEAGYLEPLFGTGSRSVRSSCSSASRCSWSMALARWLAPLVVARRGAGLRRARGAVRVPHAVPVPDSQPARRPALRAAARTLRARAGDSTRFASRRGRRTS